MVMIGIIASKIAKIDLDQVKTIVLDVVMQCFLHHGCIRPAQQARERLALVPKPGEQASHNCAHVLAVHQFFRGSREPIHLLEGIIEDSRISLADHVVSRQVNPQSETKASTFYFCKELAWSFRPYPLVESRVWVFPAWLEPERVEHVSLEIKPVVFPSRDDVEQFSCFFQRHWHLTGQLIVGAPIAKHGKDRAAFLADPGPPVRQEPLLLEASIGRPGRAPVRNKR